MESNKLNRKVKYKRINEKSFLVFIPMILSPIFGVILYVEADWWMFFTFLLVYVIQFICSIFLSTDPHMSVVTIEADEINEYAAREKKILNTVIGLYIFIAILDMFPYYATSKTFMKFLFYPSDCDSWMVKTYEGEGVVLIFPFVIFILFIFFLSVIFIKEKFEDNIFRIRDDYAKTGLTPAEQAEKDKQIAAQKEAEIVRKEKEIYGEDYWVIDRDLDLYINETSQTIFIKGRGYNFSDILSFSVQDNGYTISSGSTSVITTDNGSMIGRAAVGSLVAGNVGAVIGGATATRIVETSGTTSSVIHDYSVVITVNSLYSPMIILELEENQRLMNQISSILTVIVNRNRSKTN